MISRVTHNFKKAAKSGANLLGIEISRYHPNPASAEKDDVLSQQKLAENAIKDRHNRQTFEDISKLNKKYSQPVFGKARTWELILMLGQVVDPTDRGLGNASQLVHILQIIDAMKADSVLNDEFLLMAIIHDLGKLLLLTNEDPANIVCMNRFITSPNQFGMHNHVSQWNHDELAFMRLNQFLPTELSWLLRYHSIMPRDLKGYMDEGETMLCNRYHSIFYKYDQGSKSPTLRPQTKINEYKAFIQDCLPSEIIF
jgi:hypothetical protein